ncbi:DUF7545 family protein [Salinarchaeum laminariae]|uniref:DUF7545 family protein n=1 Tax=Salinarchaeum laminariae TaxID=869888 RepID=UPI0020BD9503|nr:hypothetical protein [Salinarchaeum laminariae]
MADTYTLTIESDSEHESEEIDVPVAAIEALGDDESPTEMAGDLVLLGLAQQMHSRVFHAEEAPQEAVKEANELLEEAFEERFGQTFQEMAGHDH